MFQCKFRSSKQPSYEAIALQGSEMKNLVKKTALYLIDRGISANAISRHPVLLLNGLLYKVNNNNNEEFASSLYFFCLLLDFWRLSKKFMFLNFISLKRTYIGDCRNVIFDFCCSCKKAGQRIDPYTLKIIIDIDH